MIPHHVYYQLAILGLWWLWVMLHYAWPSRGAPSHPTRTDPVPIPFKRKCSRLISDSRGVMGQVWRNTLFLQASPEGHGQ